MAEQRPKVAQEREVRADATGVDRLVAAPGEEIPRERVAVGPPGVTMAPQQWDHRAARFAAGVDDPNADSVEALNAAQGTGPDDPDFSPDKGPARYTQSQKD